MKAEIKSWKKIQKHSFPINFFYENFLEGSDFFSSQLFYRFSNSFFNLSLFPVIEKALDFFENSPRSGKVGDPSEVALELGKTLDFTEHPF